MRCCYVYNRNLLATGKNQLPCKWQVSGNHRVALQTTHSSAAARSLTPWIITCWNGANLSIKDEGMVHDIKQRNNRHLCHFRRVLLNWNTFTNLVEFLFPELWKINMAWKCSFLVQHVAKVDWAHRSSPVVTRAQVPAMTKAQESERFLMELHRPTPSGTSKLRCSYVIINIIYGFVVSLHVLTLIFNI